MIKKLDIKSIQKICANHIINGIQGIIKQLIDNAIDAEAKNIKITIIDYGKNKISVQDDGNGIYKQDLRNIALSGWTSKIENFQQLEIVNHLGFRGQALFALRTLSNLQITSRRKDEQNGYKIRFFDQQIIKCEHHIGSTIQVNNIFESIPVRRLQFISKQKQNLSKVLKLVKQYSLLYYDKGFKLISNIQNKVQLLFAVNPTHQQEKIKQIIGQKYFNLLMKLQQQIFKIWIPKQITSGSCQSIIKKNIFYSYYGKRIINIPQDLKKILKQIYLQYNKKAKFIAIIKIKQKIKCDVNLDPSKRDVLFLNSRQLFQQIKQTIIKYHEQFRAIIKINNPQKKTKNVIKKQLSSEYIPTKKIYQNFQLGKSNAVKKLSFKFSLNKQNQQIKQIRNQNKQNKQFQQNKKNFQEKIQIFQIEQSLRKQKKQIQQLPQKKLNKKNTMEIQIDKLQVNLIKQQNSVLNDNQLLIILSNEKSKNSKRSSSPRSPRSNTKISQKIPIFQQYQKKNSFFSMLKIIGQFNLGFILCIDKNNRIFIIDQHAASQKWYYEKFLKEEIQKIKVNQLFIQKQIINSPELLKKNGFTYEVLQNKIQIKTVGKFMGTIFNSDDFKQLILLGQTWDGKNLIRPTKFYKNAANKACRKAIMIGDKLSYDQMINVVYNLSKLQSPWNCPHGRPTVIELQEVQMQKQPLNYQIQ